VPGKARTNRCGAAWTRTSCPPPTSSCTRTNRTTCGDRAGAEGGEGEKAAEGTEEHWTTLQIAYSGILPPKVPIFPTIREERFMAYQAIVAGARGLVFFGGDLAQVMRPVDAAQGGTGRSGTPY
jgi:hypothetical protein